MGKKKIAVLSKAQRKAVRLKKEGISSHERAYCRRSGRVELVDFNEELRRSRSDRESPNVRAAMAAVQALVGHGYRAARVRGVIKGVGEIRPRLLDVPYLRVILALGYAPRCGNLQGWSPPGKGSRAALRSLVQHVVGPYPLPVFLIDSLLAGRMLQEEIRQQLLVADAVANGRSLYKNQGELLGGVRLTRRMCHTLLGTGAALSLIPAVRRAQVLGHGGSHALALELGRGFFRESLPDEEFWDEVIHWLCRQGKFDFAQIGPVCDYLEHARAGNPGYSIKGRTWASVRRRMHLWHEDLAMARRLRGGGRRSERRVVEYRPSGFRSLSWNEPVKKGRKVVEQIPWSVREILTVDDLVAEGHAMAHCVASYGALVERGAVSIWSLSCRKKRLATIEVRNGPGQVVQVRGRGNRLPTAAEARALRYWSARNALVINCEGF